MIGLFVAALYGNLLPFFIFVKSCFIWKTLELDNSAPSTRIKKSKKPPLEIYFPIPKHFSDRKSDNLVTSSERAMKIKKKIKKIKNAFDLLILNKHFLTFHGVNKILRLRCHLFKKLTLFNTRHLFQHGVLFLEGILWVRGFLFLHS